MGQKTSLSTEGWVWYKKYHESLKRWSQSMNADSSALNECIKNIGYLLQRSPENHELVQQLCIQLSMIGQNNLSLNEVTKIADVGTVAASIADESDNTDTMLRSALLQLGKAKIALNKNKRVEGLLALKSLDFSKVKGDENLVSGWVKAKWQYLTGQLNELGLEKFMAFENYENGVRHAEVILAGKKKIKSFFDEWFDLVYQHEFRPKKMSDPMAFAAPELEMKTIYTYCLMGMIRTFIGKNLSREKKQLAKKTVKAIKKFGLPQSIHQVDIIDVVDAMPSKEGAEFSDWVLNEGIENLYLPKEVEFLNKPATKFLYDRMMQNSKKNADINRPVWEVVLKIGLARAFLWEKRADKTERLRAEALKITIKSNIAIIKPIVFGFTTSLYWWYKQPDIAETAELFMFSFAAMIETDKRVWESPQIRKIFDHPISIATEIAIEKFSGNSNDEAQRIKLSVLLDLFRSAELPFLKSFYMMDSSKKEDSVIDRGSQIASDTIGRVSSAIKDCPSTCAIVIQSLRNNKTSFISISNKRPVPQVYIAEESYMKKIEQLIAAQKDDLSAVQAGLVAQHDELLIQGQSAFDSMPKEIRQAMSNNNTILIAPDFRTNQDVVPFELMHNGKYYLGEEKVIARFTSLAQMASSLDSPLYTPGKVRALITQASTTDEMEWLASAESECSSISYLLDKKGYDVPAIAQERLSGDFFIDRFSYVDIWHMAAHGESEAGTEWLVLPKAQIMVVDDFYARTQRSFPFVYLNTCHLGETRYLGAGISKGIAFNLVELGAPAVIANTIEMLDKETSSLAISFYQYALQENIGNALRLARKDALQQGLSPSLWGSAILLGSPFHVLPNSEAQQPDKEDIAFDLLNSYLGVDTEHAEERWQKAVQSLKETFPNPKLEASMLLINGSSAMKAIQSIDDVAHLEECIRLADLLHHLPARGMLRFIKATGYFDLALDQEAIIALQDAIQFIESLSSLDDRWNNLLMDARNMLREVDNKNVYSDILDDEEPGTHADRKDMDDILKALSGIYAQQEAEMGKASVREEHGLKDITHNAVVVGYPNRFEDMPETMAYIHQLANKLIQQGYLEKTTTPYANNLLAAMLKHLWSTQNLMYLSPEMVQGQAGTLQVFIDDINKYWKAPGKTAWFQHVKNYPKQVDKALKYIDSLKWEEIYKHLDRTMDELFDLAVAQLKKVKKKHPEVLGLCNAYVAGVVMEKNTFSPLQGSVPESIGERLDDLYYKLSKDHEAMFFNYLTEGFKSVREKELNELERWKMEKNK